MTNKRGIVFRPGAQVKSGSLELMTVQKTLPGRYRVRPRAQAGGC